MDIGAEFLEESSNFYRPVVGLCVPCQIRRTAC